MLVIEVMNVMMMSAELLIQHSSFSTQFFFYVHVGDFKIPPPPPSKSWGGFQHETHS